MPRTSGPHAPFEPVRAIGEAQLRAEWRKRIEKYFDELKTRFDSASAGIHTTHSYALGRQCMEVRIAGSALESILTRAFAHLPPAASSPTLIVRCWDGAETGLPLPPPPWSWPRSAILGSVPLPDGAEPYRVTLTPDGNSVMLYRADTAEGFLWARRAAQLETQHHCSPLLRIIHWWSRDRGLTLVHAGCVGRGNAGVLLVGPSGSGKSSTSILCAQAGMRYLSDDYCVISREPGRTAFCLYSTGKLHAHQSARVARLADNPYRGYEPGAKDVFFMHETCPEQIALQLEIRAIVVPRVTGEPDTRMLPASPAEALRALAPSTLFQVAPGDSHGVLRVLAELVRSVPCRRLELGTRFETVAPCVQALL